MKYTFRKKIYGYECDVYGHLNNANYLALLEAARTEAMGEMNIPVGALLEKGIQFLIHHCEMDYLQAVNLEDTVTVISWFFEMNRLKGRWQQEVYNSQGEKCFSAVLTIVFASEGKAKRLPPDVFEGIVQYIERAG